MINFFEKIENPSLSTRLNVKQVDDNGNLSLRKYSNNPLNAYNDPRIIRRKNSNYAIPHSKSVSVLHSILMNNEKSTSQTPYTLKNQNSTSMNLDNDIVKQLDFDIVVQGI